METRCGGLLFTSNFDSGNLDRVEKVMRDDQDGDTIPSNYLLGGDLRPDYEFNVWTRPDCSGTTYENGNRSWFYFGVKGGSPGRLIKINILNLNRQGKLYSQGHAPLVKTLPGRPKWERIRDRPSYQAVDNNFVLSFTHRFLDFKGASTYFAFCYPWSYTESQEQLAGLDKQFEYCKTLTANSCKNPSMTYYHRETLCYSLDRLRIDLLTISDYHNLTDEMEPRFDPKLFPDDQTDRCKTFKGKRVYLVSSRVHPGETPASFVFNGFLEFILHPDDPRARQLRKQYVFKLIPMLNPDGVMRGHYRTDSRGVNLNRMYLDPSFELYPSIYASKSVLVYHHIKNKVNDPAEGKSVVTQTKTLPGASMDIGANSSEPVGQNKAAANHSSAKEHQLRSPRNSKVVLKMSGSTKEEPIAPASCHKTFTVVYQNSNLCESESERRSPMCVYSPSSAKSDGRLTVENLENITDLGSPPPPEQSSSMENFQRLLDKVDHMSLDSDLAGAESNADYESLEMCQSRLESMRSSNELASGGECEDIEDYGPGHIGNEGSDDEDSCIPLTEGVYAPHLSDAKLRDIPASQSGVAFYIDLHGHASKRGCFIYGNYFENEDVQVENMLFTKLIALNTAHFDFTGCNFTEKNMYMKDKKDGLSKEGAGRVALYKALGIVHSYTLECNYNTGRTVNAVPPALGDHGRATPPPLAGFPPKYTPVHFEEVGKAMAIAALDMTEANPWCRLPQSEYNSLHGVREFVRRHLRGLRGLSRPPGYRPQRQGSKTGISAGPSGSGSVTGFIPRVALLASRPNPGSDASGQTSSMPQRSTNPVLRKAAPVSVNARRELAPLKDQPPRVNTMSTYRTRPRRITSNSSIGATASTSLGSTAAGSIGLHQSASAPTALTLQSSVNHQKPISSHEKRSSQCQALSTTPPADFGVKSAPRGYPGSHASQPTVVWTTGLTMMPSAPATVSSNSNNSTQERQPSAGSLSIASLEEEKVQQLRKIPNLGVQHRMAPVSGSQTANQTLEPPKSDPVKRKNKRTILLSKRRSASHSPNSAKGPRKLSVGATSGTDSDAAATDKKYKGRRKKTLTKPKWVRSTVEATKQSHGTMHDIEEMGWNCEAHQPSTVLTPKPCKHVAVAVTQVWAPQPLAQPQPQSRPTALPLPPTKPQHPKMAVRKQKQKKFNNEKRKLSIDDGKRSKLQQRGKKTEMQNDDNNKRPDQCSVSDTSSAAFWIEL